MEYPQFTNAEQSADSGVRRKWFDVEHNSLPPTFYLVLLEPMLLTLGDSDAIVSKVTRCAVYERVPRGVYPDKLNHLDVYEYKGDTWK